MYGGSIGGPIVRNKAFFFFNYEGTRSKEAANLNFPASAAPLATPYSTTTAFSGPNTFLRLDYHANGNNQISFRWTREAIITQRDSIEDNKSILGQRHPRKRRRRHRLQRVVDVDPEQPRRPTS